MYIAHHVSNIDSRTYTNAMHNALQEPRRQKTSSSAPSISQRESHQNTTDKLRIFLSDMVLAATVEFNTVQYSTCTRADKAEMRRGFKRYCTAVYNEDAPHPSTI